MSELYLRHIRRRLLRQVTTMTEASPAGSLILISGPEGSGRAGILDALTAPLSNRPQVRIPLFPWNRDEPGSLTALLPPLTRNPDDAGAGAGPVLFIDDLHHGDPTSVRHLVTAVRQAAAGTVVATVEGDGLDHLASRVLRLPPLTLAETAAYLRAITGHRVPVGTVEVIHELSGGLPDRIDDLVAAAPAGELAVPGHPVSLPETWHRRWSGICADLSPETVRALHVGDPAELDTSGPEIAEALARGILRSVPQAGGRRLEFRDVRDAAVAAGHAPHGIGTSPATPDHNSPDYERLHLNRALSSMARLDLPGAELYLDECRGRVEPGRQESLRGYLALYGGRRRQAHTWLDRPGTAPDPEDAVRGVLLSLADWDPHGMRRKVAEIRRGGDPESTAVVEAEILGLLAEAAITGRMPAMELQPTNAINRQRLDMVHGWLALAFDDPLTAREKLRPPPGHSPVIGLWQDAWLARTLYVLGEWSDAVRVVERGLATAEAHGIHLLEPLLLWTGVQISAMQGDTMLYRHYLMRLPVGEDAFLIQRLPSAMGRMIVSAADPDLRPALRAGEQLARIVNGADTQQPGFWPWEDVYAQTLIRSGQIELADQVITSAEERHTPSGLVSLLAKNAVPRATIQLQRGEHEAGLRTFQEAVEAISEAPMPAYQARVLFEYGKVLRRHGRRSRADDVLSRAAEVFAQMGATAMVERCVAERRISGVGGHQRSRHGLTPQEERIASRVAEGATNSEVARELTLSTKTVEYHLTRVYRKLGLRSRQELQELLGRV